MSFNTTWGSSTRQDHQTFMNGSQPLRSRDTQQQYPSANSAPLSYGIGASTSPPRLSAKPPSRGAVDYPSDVAAEHHARLKQRNESVFDRDPEPTVIPYKDTSVNVANAIHRAVTQPTLMNGKSNSSRFRRQPSAEPRLGLPPVPGKGTSVLNSLNEGDRSEEDEGRPRRFERAKSPMEHLVGAAAAVVRAVSPGIQAAASGASGAAKQVVGSVFLQPPSKSFQSFAVPRSPSRSGSPTKNNSIDNAGDSYNYSAEEQLANNLPSGLRATSSLNGRKSKRKLDHDQKAYKPTEDSENEDEDVSDGGSRRKKKGVIVKGLTNLPVVGPEKKRRSMGRKDRGSGGSSLMEDREGSLTSHASQGSLRNKPSSTSSHAGERNGRNLTPLASRPPFEEHPSEFMVEGQIRIDQEATRGDIDLDDSYQQSSDVEDINPQFVDDGQDSPDISADNSGESSHTPSFQLGATLGKAVHAVITTTLRIVLMVVAVLWQALSSSFDLIVARPASWVSGIAKQFPTVFSIKTASAILLIGAIWYATLSGPSQVLPPSPVPGRRNDGWGSWLSSFRRRPTYTPPEMPAGSVDELVQRLLSLETAFAQLSEEHRSVSQERDKIAHQAETDNRERAVVKSKLDALEAKLDGETRRAITAEESYRASSRHGVDSAVELVGSLREEVKSLGGSIAAIASRPVGIDRKAEERMGLIEAQLKDVTEKALKTAAKGKKDNVKLVSSDGKDISQLVASMVSRDAVGMPDYALYYTGGAVAPWMTSPSLILASSWLGKDITGRPPVTVLVPDNSVGNCWPFAGSRGQIGIQLSRILELTHVSIDHPRREILPDERTAPRGFNVWIAVEGEENIKKAEAYRNVVEARRDSAEAKGLEVKGAPPKPFGRWNMLHVGSFEYDLREGSPNVQTFELDNEVKALGIHTGGIVVDFTSNWGHPEHTCIYRVRAHGKQVS